MNHKPLSILKRALEDREGGYFSAIATYSKKGVRRFNEPKLGQDYRQNFSIDVDRILHSMAYTRYIDKTQVFYLVKNDHITHRVLHVQLVSKISRTIGRFLGLNEDLIEAIALGHDIGHPPFGHEGEAFLSSLCIKSGIGSFHHNIQSVRFLDKIEKKGKGWNLCLQTLDGILCHDGEIHMGRIEPLNIKTFQSLDMDILDKTQGRRSPSLCPMTMEGCVVRMADTISYIGRDIEDAIRLGLIDRSELPESCKKILGETNGTIVYTLVTNLIENSFQKPFIAFDNEVSSALKNLKKFNYERIYLNKLIKKHSNTIEMLYNFLFNQYLEDLETSNRQSVIFTRFLENMAEDYLNTNSNFEIVRDFIAGMTDSYFLDQCPKDMRPE